VCLYALAQERSNLVAPYATNATQNTNKCPHGLPVGTCPICSGVGMMGRGISKDKNKPRVPGEMSYNECMAAWMKIQAAKEAKLEAQLLQSKIIAGLMNIVKSIDATMQKIQNLPPIISQPLNFAITTVVKPILNIITKIPQIINFTLGIINNIAKFISSTSEKLASIFGEVKNFIDAKLSEPIKKRIKSILNFFAQGEENENEEVEKLKSREIKKILKSLLRRKRKKENNKKKENSQ